MGDRTRRWPQPKNSTRGRLVEQTWILGVIGYSVLRFVTAWGTLRDHGVNAWVFGIIDVGTAYPYAKSVATVAKRAAASEWKAMAWPAVVAITFFAAPYGYLAIAAREAPTGVKSALAIIVCVLAAAALFGILSSIRRLRKAEQTAESGDQPTARRTEAIDITERSTDANVQ